MKFRKIYWVTEQLDEAGNGRVSGVYTSVADLIGRGMSMKEGVPGAKGFRLSLVQLDSTRPPLGTWVSPGFDGIAQSLQEYVGTGELTGTEIDNLRNALSEMG